MLWSGHNGENRFYCFKHFVSITWHCVESVQIRSFFWSVFSRIRLEYGEIRSQRFAVTITNPSSFVSMTASEYDGGKEDKKTRIQKTFHLWKLSLDIDWKHYLSWSIYHKFLWSLFSPDVHTNSSLISLTRSTKYFYKQVLETEYILLFLLKIH